MSFCSTDQPLFIAMNPDLHTQKSFMKLLPKAQKQIKNGEFEFIHSKKSDFKNRRFCF